MALAQSPAHQELLATAQRVLPGGSNGNVILPPEQAFVIGVAYRWRERTLDPVTTIQLFFVQILHGNTACTHLRHLTKLDVTASAFVRRVCGSRSRCSHSCSAP